MANSASAKKRIRQRIRHRERNLHQLSTTRTKVKRVRSAVGAHGGKAEGGKSAEGVDPKQALREAIVALDKAAQKGVMKRRAASRRISRLTRLVQSS